MLELKSISKTSTSSFPLHSSLRLWKLSCWYCWFHCHFKLLPSLFSVVVFQQWFSSSFSALLTRESTLSSMESSSLAKVDETDTFYFLTFLFRQFTLIILSLLFLFCGFCTLEDLLDVCTSILPATSTTWLMTCSPNSWSFLISVSVSPSSVFAWSTHLLHLKLQLLRLKLHPAKHTHGHYSLMISFCL